MVCSLAGLLLSYYSIEYSSNSGGLHSCELVPSAHWRGFEWRRMYVGTRKNKEDKKKGREKMCASFIRMKKKNEKDEVKGVLIKLMMMEAMLWLCLHLR